MQRKTKEKWMMADKPPIISVCLSVCLSVFPLLGLFVFSDDERMKLFPY
jgi:hypothetical protein